MASFVRLCRHYFTGEFYASAKEMVSAYVTSRSMRDMYISLLENSLNNHGIAREEISRQLRDLTAYPREMINDYLYFRALNLWLLGAKDDFQVRYPLITEVNHRDEGVEDILGSSEEGNVVVSMY